MNTIVRLTGLAHKVFALLVLSALVVGLVPMYAFADIDIDNPEGDNGDSALDTYRVEGYVWHDVNADTVRDGINEEDVLAGWTINITNDQGDDREALTDAAGVYYFEVPAGTWTITQVVPEGWTRTTQESHEVTVPQGEIDLELGVLDSIMNFIVPTAYAAVLATYDGYNFGNNEEPVIVDDVITDDVIVDDGNGDSNADGGNGGTRIGDRDRDVLVISDSPAPLVLGDQVSAIPAGAPNTGKGGSTVTILGQFLALPRRREV